jgi:glutamyl-tRNA reductase
MMSFGVIGVSVKGGNLGLVEAMVIPEAERARRLAELKGFCNFAELVPVYTCNRTEYYYVTSQRPAGVEFRNRLLDFFFHNENKVPFEPRDITSLVAFRALRHLYQVAASLDSLVVGEAQVLGQLKQSLADAQSSGLSGSRLTNIFSDAFRIAKKIRRETPLGQTSVSMINLILESLDEHVAGRPDAKVVLVGAGPMNVRLAEQLTEKGIKNLHFVNRTVTKAQALAERFNAQATSLKSFLAGPSDADVIFTATSAPEPVFTTRTMTNIVPRDGSLLVLDFALPRDVDPEVASLPGMKVHDITQFCAQAERNRRERFRAVDAAEHMIDQAIGRAHVQNAQREFQPVMASALNEGLAYAESNLRRLFENRLSHLSLADRESITYFVRQLVQYANHLPMAALAHHADFTREDCSLLAGYDCVEERPEAETDAEHPAANRCAMRETGLCVGRGISNLDAL